MGDQYGAAKDLFYGDEPFVLNLGTAQVGRAHATELKRRLLRVLEEFNETPEAPAYTIGLLLVRGEV